MTDYLGENWQDDYYIWDCAAGTGNLLAGLTNKYNIYASTLDQADVNVMHERIDHGANLLKNNVFQFDFLNDDFSKLPQSLQDIINDEEKRKKLVVYINPPYAEATSSKTVSGTGENKSGVTTNFKINEILKPKIGNASNEIFALFMANIYEKIPGCILGQFSKMKFVNGSNFKKFKDYFLADYVSGFIVPGDTFDNVKGKFPIGFTIWNTSIKSKISTIATDIYDKKGNFNSTKNFYGELPNNINKWIKLFDEKVENGISFMGNPSPDFQHNSQLYLSINKGIEHFNFFNFTKNNLITGSIYFSIRNCIEAIWINDRDQYLFPNEGWQTDNEFQNDCLVFTLFHGQNRITTSEGTNHWIPFTEYEVNAQAKFESNFMTDFIKGKIKQEVTTTDLFNSETSPNRVSNPVRALDENIELQFSEEATAVFDAGRELWKYYHEIASLPRNDYNVNASLYDIREYFQGRNDKGRMNSKSDDATYTQLLAELRNKLAVLADKIKPKVYEYGFLKE